MSFFDTILGKWNDYVLRKTMNKWAKSAESKMKKLLSAGGKSDSNIIKNIKVQSIIKGDKAVIETNLPSYSNFVDKGRKPGKMPPELPIIKWCKRKGIQEEYIFPIRKKIGEKGIKGTNFMQPLRDWGTLMSEIGDLSAKSITAGIKDEIIKNNK